jgi:hypothetical protein
MVMIVIMVTIVMVRWWMMVLVIMVNTVYYTSLGCLCIKEINLTVLSCFFTSGV